MSETPPPIRPTPRRRRWPWIAGAVVIGVPVVGIGAAMLLLDAESLRPRLFAQVERATGRDFTAGEMRLAWSLVPTVELRDVALANAEGSSQPRMLTAERVQVQAELLPLLSREIRISRIEVEGAELRLEVDAQGRGNWVFARSAGTTVAPTTPEEGARQALALGIDALLLTRSRIHWNDARSGLAETMEIARLEAEAPLNGAISAEGEIALRGQAMTLQAETGGLAAFGAGAAWPVAATLGVQGAALQLEGNLTGQAWEGTATATIPDLARLAPLLPGVALPPLRDVTAAAAASGTGGAVAVVRDLRVTLGAADLAAYRPGLALRRASATAPGLEAPITLEAEATVEGQTLRATGTAGTPALLLAGASGPLPLDLRIEGPSVTGTAQGRIADPRALRGIDLALTVQATDLSPYGVAGAGSLTGRFALPGPGMAGGARVTGLRLAIPAAEARGDLALAAGSRVNVTGQLTFARLDLDALRAPPPAAAPAAPATPAPAPAAPTDNRMIPATPLPFAALRGFDADLRMTAPAMRAGGQDWRQVSARLVLAGGKARIAPLNATTPAGPLALEVEADATQTPPRLRVVAKSPGLDLAALSRAAGRDPLLIGRAQLDADLAGQGGDLRAVAATASGHLGLALVDGAVPRSLLRALPQQVLGAVLPAGNADIPLRCFALRAPASGGVLRLETLYAEGGLGRLGGTGQIDMRDETLAVRLQTDLRTPRIALRAPVNVAGRWNAPRVGVEPTAAAAAGLGAFLSQQETPDRSLQALAEILGNAGNRGAPAGVQGECAPALAAARGGAAGPAPTVQGAPAAPEAEAPNQQAPQRAPNAADLLRGLLGR
ncbi:MULTISPECIES: AsmA family protein [Roseomonadaceae]|uniref:AsmA family protein n=1 Tax=Falsiroseomonas oleicola TaxID=2801474 RepID=A0ABS6H1Z1_9PROT|nr:AsmA family protein [Roseomonas oleicola]MBU8542429.1 AsmA family protein [Roseomonas oleicola]